ncbi:MAG: hypothetical protein DHS20C13_29780 [Thermodesulfobacteriota bacterium]|nr:MAG: hypothetical protein DHS20C13_29780 [Thermodesulfobacteriota bacterium]
MINKTLDKESGVPVDKLFKDKEKRISDRKLWGGFKKAFKAVSNFITGRRSGGRSN